MGIAQEAHVENEIGVERDTVLEAEGLEQQGQLPAFMQGGQILDEAAQRGHGVWSASLVRIASILLCRSVQAVESGMIAADCAADGCWEFLLSAPPLKVTGGLDRRERSTTWRMEKRRR